MTNQIAGKWKTKKGIVWRILQVLFQNFAVHLFDFKITRILDQMALHLVQLLSFLKVPKCAVLPEVTGLSASLVFSKLTSLMLF